MAFDKEYVEIGDDLLLIDGFLYDKQGNLVNPLEAIKGNREEPDSDDEDKDEKE